MYGMEIKITGEAAEALVKNIETYAKDGFGSGSDDEIKNGMLVLFGIKHMMQDVLRQVGRFDRELTDLEIAAREGNPYYSEISSDVESDDGLA